MVPEFERYKFNKICYCTIKAQSFEGGGGGRRRVLCQCFILFTFYFLTISFWKQIADSISFLMVNHFDPLIFQNRVKKIGFWWRGKDSLRWSQLYTKTRFAKLCSSVNSAGKETNPRIFFIFLFTFLSVTVLRFIMCSTWWILTTVRTYVYRS